MTPPPFEDGEPAFVALEGLFEVEVRSLAGESWACVIPTESTVATLRASIAMTGSGLTSKPHQLFAEGRQLDEDDTLPEPPPGERLVVHIASDCVTKVESDNETTSDAPESPSRRAAYPEATIKRYATTAGYSQRTWWAMIVLTVLAASAAAFLAGGTARVPISDDKWARAEKTPPPSAVPTITPARVLAWGAGPLTAKLAIDARELLANESRLSFRATVAQPSATSEVASDSGQPPIDSATTATVRTAPATSGTPPTTRPAPATPRPLFLSLTLSAPPAATPLPAAVGGASSRAGEVEEAAASSAGAIKLNASASWDFESLLRAAYTAAGGESSPPEHAQVSEAPNWRKQALRVAKFVPLTSAALALWRPAGKRILALVLVVARTLLPAKRCEAFARFVQANGLVPKGFEGIGQVCASARDRTGPAEAEKKKF